MSSPDQVTALKCALRFRPPTLVLFYRDTTTGKTRRRSMPLRGFSYDTDVAVFAESLERSRRHGRYIQSIPQAQIRGLLQRVKEAQDSINEQGLPLREQSSLHNLPALDTAVLGDTGAANEGTANPIFPAENGNSMLTGISTNDEPSSGISKLTTVSHPSNGPPSPGNDYSDDFNSEASPLAELSLAVEDLCKCSSSSDSHHSAAGSVCEDDLAGSISDLLTGSSDHTPLHRDHAPPTTEQQLRYNDSGEDLNRATKERLIQAKAEMEEGFEANRLKPGDQGYEYDREVEFQEEGSANPWDSEAGEEEEEGEWGGERLETGFDFDSGGESELEF